MLLVWRYYDIFKRIFIGRVCLVAQVILDNRGHLTSGLTVVGAFLSYLGVYDKLVLKCGAGATTLISNIGHMLYSSGIAGYEEAGILGIFTKLLCSSGVALVSVIVFSFVFTIIFKAKD